jgi:hypothetical protein
LGLLAVAGVLAAVAALAQQPAAPVPASPACGELARRFDLIAAEAGSLERTTALFAAGDAEATMAPRSRRSQSLF